MPRFDITLKSLLQEADIAFVRLLTGSGVRAWLDVELPRVRNLRVDRLGETDAGDLVQIELQTANDRQMAVRMAHYFLHIYERYGRAPRQFALYVGKPILAMPDSLVLPGFHYRYRLLDVRTVDGEELLASPNINDNILAVLTKLKDTRAALRQIVSRIATLKEAEQQTALAQLTVLAGLRDLEQSVREEIDTMPATINLLENKVLGPMILEELEKRQKIAIEQGIERGIEQGIERGLEKGLEQGEHMGRIAVLGRQIEKRFGPLAPGIQGRLAQLSPAQLDDLSLRILDARTIDELFTPREG